MRCGSSRSPAVSAAAALIAPLITSKDSIRRSLRPLRPDNMQRISH